MRFESMKSAVDYLMATRRAKSKGGLDEHMRNLSPTRNLLLATGLIENKREYCVVTGSKGKGSTAAITAKLLESLGHKTGLITSPHMRIWNERIRINGQAIPDADFTRLLSDLSPLIDAEIAQLAVNQHISPQGILLLVALRWWDEQGVTAAVVEVGRGGRFDDMSLVPNKVSLITPIFMEHAQYLGDSLERIAWHKAGIIKEGGFVYSVAQDPLVLDVIQREAEAKQAEFFWFSQMDLGEYLHDTPEGIVFRLQRYGEINLPLYGRYAIQNATLAVQAVGNMHARLQGIDHSSPEYIEAIRRGLEQVRWPGRLQKLQGNPAVYVDGAINVLSAQDFLSSLEHRISKPLVTVLGVPKDRDVEGVFRVYAQASDALILTESDIHPNMPFPAPEEAIAIAKRYHRDVQYAQFLPQALELAYAKAGKTGTILLAVAQPLVGEAMLIWDVDMWQI
jgi:dihydrofolate synthase / folylpolyglutamate synthase